MAKTSRNRAAADLAPGQSRNQAAAAATEAPEVAEAAETATAVDGIRYVTIRVPLAPVTDGYLPAQVNVNLLSHRGGRHMREALRGMNKALNQTHACLRNGKHVDDNASVVRWLLEQVADAQPEE